MASNTIEPHREVGSPTLTLSLSELFKITVEFGKFTAAIWGIYVTICTGLTGWLLTISIPLFSRIELCLFVVLLTVFFAIIIDAHHNKTHQLYYLIKHHPELKAVPADFAEGVHQYAKSFSGWTNRIALPIFGTLMSLLIFLAGAR
jgi:hypothetical protein